LIPNIVGRKIAGPNDVINILDKNETLAEQEKDRSKCTGISRFDDINDKH